jgi:hypothetical protein
MSHVWRDKSSDRALPEDERGEVFYHVTPSANRESIRRHGLDWTRMGAAPGIASGLNVPEEPGSYLATESEIDWFVEMCNHRELVDVWEVRASGLELVLTGSGFVMCPSVVPPQRLVLLRVDIDPVEAKRRSGQS